MDRTRTRVFTLLSEVELLHREVKKDFIDMVFNGIFVTDFDYVCYIMQRYWLCINTIKIIVSHIQLVDIIFVKQFYIGVLVETHMRNESVCNWVSNRRL
jgi:hypothetical protein